MSENSEVLRCRRCGKEVRKNVDGLYSCIDKKCRWRSYGFEPQPQPATEKEGKPGVALTSGQTYRMGLEDTLGLGTEREVYRLLARLENLQTVITSSDSIIVTCNPGGGKQKLPLAQDTKSVDINSAREIHLHGKYPYAIVDIAQNCSGQPVSVTCHVKT